MNDSPKQAAVLKDQKGDQANCWLVTFMQDTLEDSRKEVYKLQQKLSWTYGIIIGLSILMFCVGIGLLVVSAVKGFRGDELDWQTFTIGGLGLVDLAGLYFFRPIEQIRKLMADMSQIIVAINSHQTQVSLRLLETNSEDRATMGQAADYIKTTARDSLKNIQTYFEEEAKRSQASEST